MASPIHLAPGQMFARDFRVVRPLSSGGMGSVYVVHQVSTGSERALKLMHRELVENPKLRTRFEQEAKIGSTIKSDHVVKVISAGIDDESGNPYLVMELLEGGELEQVLASRGPLPPGEVALIFSQLCHALSAAHAAGVVHRDLKPENIFIATSQRADVPFTVKILDFGIAKVTAEAKQSATQSLGTPLYMAPEQADPRAQITPAADVWALGLIAFRALAGANYWLGANGEGGTIEMIMAEVLIYDIAPPSERARELNTPVALPPGFDDWFLGCVRRDAKTRFATAGDAWRSLAPILGAPQLSSTPHGHPQTGSYGGGYPTIPGGASGGYGYPQTPHPTAVGSASGPQVSGAYASGPQGQTFVPSRGSLASNPAFAIAATHASITTGGTHQTATTGPRPGRSKAPLLAAGALLLGLLGVGGFFAYKHFSREKTPEVVTTTTYCAETNDRYLVGDCLVEIPAEDQKHRPTSYRRIEKAGQVTVLERINGHGRLVDDERGVASWSYTYASATSKLPKEITVKNRLGVIQHRRLVNETGTHIDVVDAWGEPSNLKDTHAVAYDLVLDDKGYQTEERYFNARQKPTFSAEHVYGYRYKRDDKNRIISITGIDADGKPMRTADWMASVTQTYDARGFMVAARYQDDAGLPVLNKSGVAGYEQEYDKYGRPTLYKNLSSDGRVVPTTRGIASMSNEYNDAGDLTKFSFLDSNGKLTTSADGYAGFSLEYDDHGNFIKRAFFDADAKPTYTAEGYAMMTAKNDDRDLQIETEYFDVDGKPVSLSANHHLQRTKWDDHGNMLERRYFGVDGKPTRTNERVAATKWQYDDHDRLIVELNFDPSDQPTISSSWYSKRTIKYDTHGNVTEVAFFDASGAPTGGQDGVAKSTRTADELGNNASWANFDEQGHPVQQRGSFATMKAKYDDNGTRTDIEYFGADGARVVVGPASVEHSELDKYGNILTTARLGADGQPMKPISKHVYEYDSRDHQVVTSYYGPSGALVGATGNVASFKRRYDERGNHVEERYFGVDGKPVLNEGIAGWVAKYDSVGHVVDQGWIGFAGEPVMAANKSAKIRTKYDPWGNTLEVAYLGFNDESVTSAYNAAFVRRTYDRRGNELTYFAYTPTEQPALVANGYHGYEVTYDDRGNNVRVRYLDDKLQTSKHFLLVTNVYDELDQRVERSYASFDGKPDINTDHVHIIRWKYDDRGRVVEETNFGKDSKPAADTNNVAIRRYKYDMEGHQIEEAVFGVDGKPATNADGWSVKRMIYGAGKLEKTELVAVGGSVVRTVNPQPDQ